MTQVIAKLSPGDLAKVVKNLRNLTFITAPDSTFCEPQLNIIYENDGAIDLNISCKDGPSVQELPAIGALAEFVVDAGVAKYAKSFTTLPYIIHTEMYGGSASIRFANISDMVLTLNAAAALVHGDKIDLPAIIVMDDLKRGKHADRKRYGQNNDGINFGSY